MWKPEENFESGLRKTARWYLDNRWWWQAILTGTNHLERLGAKSGQAKDQAQLNSDSRHDQ
jgi:dTDP-glucose 4,6-dehydratase